MCIRDRLMPDVILLDIQMENLDGLSAARVIGEECPNTAIIMLTAFSNGEYIDKAKENKISCYLPVSYTHLDVYKRQFLWLVRNHTLASPLRNVKKLHKT